MNDELNLDELAQFCKDLVIEDSYVQPYGAGKEGSIHIGGYIDGEYAGVGTKDYVPLDRANKLVKLLTMLPRLIDLCKDQRECIKTLSSYALHERCAEQE